MGDSRALFGLVGDVWWRTLKWGSRVWVASCYGVKPIKFDGILLNEQGISVLYGEREELEAVDVAFCDPDMDEAMKMHMDLHEQEVRMRAMADAEAADKDEAWEAKCTP